MSDTPIANIDESKNDVITQEEWETQFEERTEPISAQEIASYLVSSLVKKVVAAGRKPEEYSLARVFDDPGYRKQMRVGWYTWISNNNKDPEFGAALDVKLKLITQDEINLVEDSVRTLAKQAGLKVTSIFLDRLKAVEQQIIEQDGQVQAKSFSERMWADAQVGLKYSLLAHSPITDDGDKMEINPVLVHALKLLEDEKIKITHERGAHCWYHIASGW